MTQDWGSSSPKISHMPPSLSKEEGDGLIGKDRRQVPQVPDDCVYEILTRIAASSLRPCLRVCRSWRRLAYQPIFDEVQSLRTAKMPGFLLATLQRNEYSYSFMPIHGPHSPIPITSLLPCDPRYLRVETVSPASGGLIYFAESTSTYGHNCKHIYYVTHLSPLHHRRIPCPKIRCYYECTNAVCSGVGNHYKILRICEVSRRSIRQKHKRMCEIFDSVSGNWRISVNIPCFLFMGKRAEVIGQTAYWVVNENVIDKLSIFSFNVEKERGWIMEAPAMPSGTTKFALTWDLVGYEDRLCLVHFSDEEVKVWMMTVKCCVELQNWEWWGSISPQRLKDHRFAFEDGISDKDVGLLETLYRKFWYQLEGMSYIYSLNPPMHSWKVDLDVADLSNLVKK